MLTVSNSFFRNAANALPIALSVDILVTYLPRLGSIQDAKIRRKRWMRCARMAIARLAGVRQSRRSALPHESIPADEKEHRRPPAKRRVE